MKPVDQTIVCKDRGDCMRATIASLFDLEIEQVPHFILFGANYFDLVWSFFRFLGYDYMGCGYIHTGPPKEEDSVNGYFYGVVNSKTFPDVTHAVVIDINGIVVHDPNPNKRWQDINVLESGELKYWYLIGRYNPND